MMARAQGQAVAIRHLRTYALVTSMIDVRGFHPARAETVAIGGAGAPTEPLLV
ncbi:hypothetical protein [Novosphingobium sp. HII-3]|uniref:hypothetical protein n=1 Tax=Novosphingobium sp. HII-3 TaxID=2075565 RepID=UPI001E2F711B|nr:hypothetical protein [Novosphingobium sp. HII-3]